MVNDISKDTLTPSKISDIKRSSTVPNGLNEMFGKSCTIIPQETKVPEIPSRNIHAAGSKRRRSAPNLTENLDPKRRKFPITFSAPSKP